MRRVIDVESLEIRVRLAQQELFDAAEDIERLLEREEDDVSPAMRDLLFALDDAITDTFRDAALRWAPRGVAQPG